MSTEVEQSEETLRLEIRRLVQHRDQLRQRTGRRPFNRTNKDLGPSIAKKRPVTKPMQIDFPVSSRPKITLDDGMSERTRRMFGLGILGHLKKAKADLQSEENTSRAKMHKDKEAIVEMKLQLEKKNIGEIKKKEFRERRQKELEELTVVVDTLTERENDLMRLQLTKHYTHMRNFIGTEAQPTIFWLPNIWSESTIALQQKTQEFIDKKIQLIKETVYFVNPKRHIEQDAADKRHELSNDSVEDKDMQLDGDDMTLEDESEMPESKDPSNLDDTYGTADVMDDSKDTSNDNDHAEGEIHVGDLMPAVEPATGKPSDEHDNGSVTLNEAPLDEPVDAQEQGTHGNNADQDAPAEHYTTIDQIIDDRAVVEMDVADEANNGEPGNDVASATTALQVEAAAVEQKVAKEERRASSQSLKLRSSSRFSKPQDKEVAVGLTAPRVSRRLSRSSQKNFAKSAGEESDEAVPSEGDSGEDENIKVQVTKENAEKLKVADLKAYLKKHDLPSSGRKSDLVKFVLKHLEENSENPCGAQQ